MKVTFIGAGSAVFAAEVIKDILLIDGINEGIIGLVDIDSERLKVTEKIAKFLIKKTGKKFKLETSTDRNEILPGSDYVVNTIEVAGPQNVEKDYEIPLKYGVDQCIGDTIGPGGLFKALRTLPAWLNIVDDIMKLCPDALVMNYTNPMSLTVLAAIRATKGKIRIVGLCHSIQQTSKALAEYLDMPYTDLDWRAAGINHMAWFIKLEDKNGVDLYPKLIKKSKDESLRIKDPVRFHLMEHFGAFMTESSGHVSEYLPFIRKRQDIIDKHTGPEYLGESGFYKNMWPEERQQASKELEEMMVPGFVLERGEEFASYIIEGEVLNKPTVIHGNVLNQGMIPNLPSDGVVEVACLIDNKGVQSVYFGELPTHMANYNKQHMAFHDLVVDSVLTEDRSKAFYALMVDPLTSAVCSLEEIRDLFNEMVEAEKEYLPKYLIK